MTTDQTADQGVAQCAPQIVQNIDRDVLGDAVRHALAATAPEPLGEYGQAFLVPQGYQLEVKDERSLSDPVVPHHRVLAMSLVGVDSFVRYIDRFKSEDSLIYLRDINGRAQEALLKDCEVGTCVLDDYPTTGPETTSFRSHLAHLVLRPTAAAKRWGAVLNIALAQETFVDLLDDGISEIYRPDAGDLRDIIADLKVARTTTAAKALPKGGSTSISLNENVDLHGGKGNEIVIPEKVVIGFHPFAGIDDTIIFDVKLRPRVLPNNSVVFRLDAPDLDERLTTLLLGVATEITEATSLPLHWVP